MRIFPLSSAALATALCVTVISIPSTATKAEVSVEKAAQLKTTLTPLGGERAGSADGQIPAWTGGYTAPLPDRKRGGPFTDPFSADKPLLTITSKNMDVYADKLTDGTKALFKKYPDYKLVVYVTRRTAAAPQWIYDNTLLNATRGSIKGYAAEHVFGGIPFPIPQSGIEAMYNHLLTWKGDSWQINVNGWQIGADGRRTLAAELYSQQQEPYYFKEKSASGFDGDYWNLRIGATAPALRAGQATVIRFNLDPDKQQAWVYLTGQRRSRQVPNECCDTPNDLTGGIMTIDEDYLYQGPLNRFDWKLVGKREIYVPYNVNKAASAKIGDLLSAHYLNPDLMRYELHRVWVVEATLRPGQRHTSPRSRYYLDEDTWAILLSERYDARGDLWKVGWTLPVVDPDFPATLPVAFGVYNLIGGTWFANGMPNDESHPLVQTGRFADSTFTGDAMASESVR